MEKHPITPTPKFEDERYWSSLGHFVEMFAFVELQLFLVLTRFTSVSNDVARAIFSGVHIETAIGLLRRTLSVAWGNLDAEEFGEALAQLKLITGKRNDIIHFGSSTVEDGTRLVTTKAKALFPADVRETRVSSRAIDAMLMDLSSIALELVAWQHLPLKQLESKRPAGGSVPKKPRTWHYKPDAPSRDRQPREQNPRGRGEPRK
jgi:hypothetical protein